MMLNMKKPYRWAAVFSVLLTAAFVYVLLDSFAIPKPMKTVVADNVPHAEEAREHLQKATITDTSYEEENIKINIEILRRYNTTVYIADIQLSDPSYLKTAFAKDTYGRNINEKISKITEKHKGILAINGDYYGFRTAGYVLRNGVSYQDTARKGKNDESLVINKRGDFAIIRESKTHMDALNTEEISQILSFGPALIKDSEIAVNSNSEINIVPFISGKPKGPIPGRATAGGKPKVFNMKTNPRTAIGQISPLHYVFIVSDGRTAENAGISLFNLAKLFAEKGCCVAYNLDGGGSSAMYFNGKIINFPTDGRVTGEREVSDIIYIGY